MPGLMAAASIALALLAAPPSPKALPFLENDYPKALAEARARKLPLFIDAWAPW